MGKLIGVLYGAIAYLIFFATFLYAIGFVGNIYVPKSLDSGVQGALVPSLLIDAILLGIFAVQHSVMARPAFKAVWTKVVPQSIERSTYVLFASLALIALYWFWQPLTATIWNANGVAAQILTGLYFVGWGIVLISTFLINHFELFGLQQVYDKFRGAGPETVKFKTPIFYGFVRHPIYFGFIVAFWSAPHMTLGHLVFSIATTGYILIGIFLEERDLVSRFGDQYLIYRRQVSMIIPWVPKRR